MTRALTGSPFAGRPAVGGYRHPAPSPRIVEAHLRRRGDAPVDLGTSYALCRRLNAAHGRTYYFATRFLPPDRRAHVHALYAFARYADDLVDHFDLSWGPDQRRAALEAWSERFLSCLGAGRSDDALLKAVVNTVGVLGIDHDDLRAFLRSMAMDLTVTRYPTYADLQEYVYGSAAVIGSMMLPVLRPTTAAARVPAMELGVAFQLTNFLRDVAEDWDRGRIYLPLEDLARFGVSEDDFRARRVGPGFRRLVAFEIERTRALYRGAETGWAMLAPSSRACIRIAHRLYGEILGRIERSDYDVFRTRARVPAARKVAIAARELLAPSQPRLPRAGPGARAPVSGRTNGLRVGQVPPWARAISGPPAEAQASWRSARAAGSRRHGKTDESE